MKFITTGSQWRITLKTGDVIGVWATAYSKIDGNYVFDLYVDADKEEQKDPGLVIIGYTPAYRERIVVAVASIPIDAVAKKSRKCPMPISTTDWVEKPRVDKPEFWRPWRKKNPKKK